MYNKVKKCLKIMGYGFLENDRVEFRNGMALEKGFMVEKSYYDKVYIEIYDNGDIVVWSYTDERPVYYISKKEDYLMMFQLGCILNS